MLDDTQFLQRIFFTVFLIQSRLFLESEIMKYLVTRVFFRIIYMFHMSILYIFMLPHTIKIINVYKIWNYVFSESISLYKKY